MLILNSVDFSIAAGFSCANARDGLYGYFPCICDDLFFSLDDLSSSYKIDCSGKKLTDMKISGILENLATSQSGAYLHHLDLSNNRLTRVPEKLRHFRNLQTINLDSNSIRSVSPGNFHFIDGTEQAREISLVNSLMKSIEPGAFQGIFTFLIYAGVYKF